MKKGREPPEPGQHGRPEREVLLLGGIANAGHVVRVGDTVRRPQRSWSAATHTLLRHLEAVGFEGAPRFLGADSQGLIHSAGHTTFAWQRSYYDRIIRDDVALCRIREYIIHNPANWDRSHSVRDEMGLYDEEK